MPLLDRFLRYVRLDTRADDASDTVPSTAKQLVLARLLADECRELGLDGVELTEHGTVYATLPATPGCDAPAVAWFAHVDTSPEFSGTGVDPQVHADYDGSDLPLPGHPTRVVRVAENPDLATLVGGTVVTTDGTTLLGGDDKCGIAVILTACERLLTDRSVAHGPIRVVFTCDEEIGRGCDHVDLAKVDAVCGYTLDGDSVGKIHAETFSADAATVTVRGVNTHPSIGKGAMVNAVRILAAFLDRLPTDTDSPETTGGRDGFLHPYEVAGGVAEAHASLILRSFETADLAGYADRLESIAAGLRAEHPRAGVTVAVRPQYRNMREGMGKEPRAVRFAEEATRAAGVEPTLGEIRGGTDGSILTAMGLPTPNLSTGQHNPHSPLEWTSVEQMNTAVRVLVELARRWGRESPGSGS